MIRNGFERESALTAGRTSALHALSMRPDTMLPAVDQRYAKAQDLKVVEIGHGAALSAFSGPNPADRTERAVFLGGALICLSFSGLRASRVGRRELELGEAESCVALLSRSQIEVSSVSSSHRTRKTVTAFISSQALDSLGVDLFQRSHDRREEIIEWKVTPAARGLAIDILNRETSDQALRLRSEALTLALLAELQERSDTKAQHPSSGVNLATARRARDIIASQPTADHTLSSIAASAGTSVTALKRDFQKAFGISPIAFLREQRLEWGRSLIESEGLSVSCAAYACGYQHPGNFAQAFRRHYGFAPSRLRR